MAGMNAHKALSFDAGADLSALQFTAVKMGTGKQVVQAADATATIVGILLNKPTSGQAAEVAVGGQTKAKAGGNIAAGDKVTATTGGVLITTTTDKNNYVGYAVTAAASGDIFELVVDPGTLSV